MKKHSSPAQAASLPASPRRCKMSASQAAKMRAFTPGPKASPRPSISVVHGGSFRQEPIDRQRHLRGIASAKPAIRCDALRGQSEQFRRRNYQRRHYALSRTAGLRNHRSASSGATSTPSNPPGAPHIKSQSEIERQRQRLEAEQSPRTRNPFSANCRLLFCGILFFAMISGLIALLPIGAEAHPHSSATCKDEC